MKSLVFYITFFLATPIWAAPPSTSSTTNTAVPTYKISVDAKLFTHFIERGLSMSDKNPALNTSFLFNLGPQFRLGFWGSNISNVSSADDNFWFKFLADVSINFSQNTLFNFYIHDDHFYKSSIRNGQRIGMRLSYALYMSELEWMNNYEGSHTASQYLNFGRLFDFRPGMRWGGKVGYTLQNAPEKQNYFDFKLLGQYEFTKNASSEAGATIVSNNSQFGGRGEAAFYLSVELHY